MTDLTAIEKYNFYQSIAANLPLYCDIAEALKAPDCQLIHDGNSGLLLRLCESNIYMLAAEDFELGKKLLSMVPVDGCSEDFEIVLRGAGGVGDLLSDYALSCAGYKSSSRCFQAMYEKELPPTCLKKLTIHAPTEGDFDLAKTKYHLLTEEDFREHFFSRDFIAGYLDNALVGFCGLHAEGSMGMLYVMEEHRRNGYAEELCAELLKRQISLHKIPYCQIFVDNFASIAMQTKLGFTFAKEHIFWASKQK